MIPCFVLAHVHGCPTPSNELLTWWGRTGCHWGEPYRVPTVKTVCKGVGGGSYGRSNPEPLLPSSYGRWRVPRVSPGLVFRRHPMDGFVACLGGASTRRRGIERMGSPLTRSRGVERCLLKSGGGSHHVVREADVEALPRDASAMKCVSHPTESPLPRCARPHAHLLHPCRRNAPELRRMHSSGCVSGKPLLLVHNVRRMDPASASRCHPDRRSTKDLAPTAVDSRLQPRGTWIWPVHPRGPAPWDGERRGFSTVHRPRSGRASILLAVRWTRGSSSPT